MNFFAPRPGYSPLPKYDPHHDYQLDDGHGPDYARDADMYELQPHGISAFSSRKSSLALTYHTHSPASPASPSSFSEKTYTQGHHCRSPSPLHPHAHAHAHAHAHPHAHSHSDSQHPSHPHSHCSCPCWEPGTISLSRFEGDGYGQEDEGHRGMGAAHMMTPKERAVVLSVLCGVVMLFGGFCMLMHAVGQGASMGAAGMVSVVEAAS